MLILSASVLAGMAILLYILTRMNENDARARHKVYRAGLSE